MTEQPDSPVQHTDVTAADLDADIEVPPSAAPATRDPNVNVDDGLEMGDEPNIRAPTNNGS